MKRKTVEELEGNDKGGSRNIGKDRMNLKRDKYLLYTNICTNK
jgi:hypothetical protein